MLTAQVVMLRFECLPRMKQVGCGFQANGFCRGRVEWVCGWSLVLAVNIQVVSNQEGGAKLIPLLPSRNEPDGTGKKNGYAPHLARHAS